MGRGEERINRLRHETGWWRWAKTKKRKERTILIYVNLKVDLM